MISFSQLFKIENVTYAVEYEIENELLTEEISQQIIAILEGWSDV